MSNLEGSIIVLMDRLREDKETLHKYFYLDSLFFEALCKHVQGPCLVIEKPTNEDGKPLELVYPKGSGPISFRKAWTYGWQMNEGAKSWKDGYKPDFYVLEFVVSFEEITKKYELRIPHDLEDNFTQEKFDIWAKKIREKLAEEKKKKDISELEKLINLYQKEAKELIKVHQK